MKLRAVIVGVMLLAGADLANAHAHLEKAVPAEGSVVTTAPSKIVLKFSEAARLTALSIQKDKEAPQKLAPLPSAAAAEISIPAPTLTPGSYVVTWRVVSDDTHIMTGKLHFTYSADSSPKRATP